jgi:HAD superfamily hydrolase (TIGR01549 family)
VSFSQIKGVIFDLGSTLIEYENRSWIEVSYDGQKLAYGQLRNFNHNLPDFKTFNNRLEEIKQKYREHAIRTLSEWRITNAPEKLLTELGLDNPKEESRRFIDAFYTVVREQLTECEGARDTLEELHNRRYKLGLISNTIFPGNLHEADLEKFGLIPYLGFRIYSCEFGLRKPHPDIFRAGLDKIGLTLSETIYVGDRYTEDIQGPRRIGMSAILKYRKGRDYPDPIPAGFPIIEKISELPDILRKQQ